MICDSKLSLKQRLQKNKIICNKIKFCKQQRLYVVLLLACFNFFISAYCQENNKNEKWEEALSEYKSGKINDSVYCEKIRLLTPDFLTDSLLKQKLEPFRKIAWSKKEYHRYRLNYYIFLTNNATFSSTSSSPIYYAEKFDEEMKKVKPFMSSFLSERLLFFIYGRNKSGYKRCLDEFKQILPDLEKLPNAILTDSVPRTTYTNATTILSYVAKIYHDTRDSAGLQKVNQLSKIIYSDLLRKKDKRKEEAPLNEVLFSVNLINYFEKNLTGTADESINLLHKTYDDIAFNSNKSWRIAAESEILMRFADFFINQKQNDSAEYYLQLYKNHEGSSIADFTDDGRSYLFNTAKLKANEGLYKTAYETILQAYESNDSIIGAKTADINNNLYAQRISEQKQEEIVQLEEQKKRRSIIIAIAVIAGSALIIMLIVLIRRKEKRAREKIEEISKLTQIEIAELEIKAKLIQRRLGMELHDDIAGNLAYLCNTIDTGLLDEHDPKYRQQLERISKMARDTYLSARNKSHDWYAEGEREQELSFKESIYKLTSYALPDKQFKKTIEIDDTSMQKVSYTTKIELLRIIQEALINILKHSGANEMQLFVYEEDNIIVVQIKDNGRGFDTKQSAKTKGVGLRSLQSRVKDLNGMLEIQSSKKGTDLTITILT